MQKNEIDIQNQMRLEASKRKMILWRNNVGAVGRVRYGLANDSTKINKVLKSADLIGIKPVLITPEHVGTVIGQFVSREVKHKGWKPSGSERDKSQAAWAELVKKYGGDALITDDEKAL